MQGNFSPKNSTSQMEEAILLARSGFNGNRSSDDQKQQDLQLLLQAYKRIRQLEEENSHLKDDNYLVQIELKNQKRKYDELVAENNKLQQINEQLLDKIISFQKKIKRLSCMEQNALNIIQKQKSSIEQQKLTKTKIPIQSNNGSLKSRQKILKQSQSTPIILNINVNPFSKQDRRSFLFSCKEEFVQQLQKIKASQNPKKPSTKNYSEYFDFHNLQSQSSHFKIHQNGFFKDAKKQFIDENSRTFKNISLIDRKKSVSSNSGSLIRKNFAGKRYVNNGERKVFCQKTNLWNSKYASIDSILLGSKDAKMKDCQSGQNLICSPSSHSSYFQGDQIQNKAAKKAQKPIYLNSEFSNSLHTPKDRTLDMMGDKVKSQIQLQLRNQQEHGIIKYRGLCL